MTIAPERPLTWTVVCAYDDLLPERGAAALVGGAQLALFRTHDGTLYALSNFDPCCGAYVLARGIVGTRGDVPVVASPMHKQAYDLRTGECLDKPGVSVETYQVRRAGGRVEVAVPAGFSGAVPARLP